MLTARPSNLWTGETFRTKLQAKLISNTSPSWFQSSRLLCRSTGCHLYSQVLACLSEPTDSGANVSQVSTKMSKLSPDSVTPSGYHLVDLEKQSHRENAKNCQDAYNPISCLSLQTCGFWLGRWRIRCGITTWKSWSGSNYQYIYLTLTRQICNSSKLSSPSLKLQHGIGTTITLNKPATFVP